MHFAHENVEAFDAFTQVVHRIPNWRARARDERASDSSSESSERVESTQCRKMPEMIFKQQSEKTFMSVPKSALRMLCAYNFYSNDKKIC